MLVALCFTKYLRQSKIPSCGICWLKDLKKPVDTASFILEDDLASSVSILFLFAFVVIVLHLC